MAVDVGTMTRFVADLFQAAGVPADDAARVAAVLLLQERRGVLTHGLRRVRRNLQWVLNGEVNPHPRRSVLRDAGAVMVLDGDHGLGMLACLEGMDAAIAKAKMFGIGIVTIINNNHFLAAAPYCLRAAEAGLIGYACSNSYASMGYPGVAGRVFGNGPNGFAAPTAAGFPLVFDAALTASYGKLDEWARTGQTIPAYLPALDAEGQPTDDPRVAMTTGTTMPIGLHKGAGLALFIEMLTGILGGGAFLTGIHAPDQRASKEEAESQCCIAIDPDHFLASGDFPARMAAFIADLKAQPFAPGYDEIVVPGERAMRALHESEQSGLTLEPDVIADLRALGEMVGVKAPV